MSKLSHSNPNLEDVLEPTEQERAEMDRGDDMAARASAHAEKSAGLGFHWTNGWYWSRTEDGSVRVVRFNPGDAEPTEVMLIDANSWCSIIAAASGDYSSGERWMEAKRFHNVA